MAYKMNLNFNYFQMLPSFFIPNNQVSQFPGVYQLNKYTDLLPAQEVKKYIRTWTKIEIEQAFKLTINYCQKTLKSIENLNLKICLLK